MGDNLWNWNDKEKVASPNAIQSLPHDTLTSSHDQCMNVSSKVSYPREVPAVLGATGTRTNSSPWQPVESGDNTYETDLITDAFRVENLCRLMENQAKLGPQMSQGTFPEYHLFPRQEPPRPNMCYASEHQVRLDDQSFPWSQGAFPDYGQLRTPEPQPRHIHARQCNFCKRNREPRAVYKSHNLKENGRVSCPVLQRYVCPLCGATGEAAHTISYCPYAETGGSTVLRTLRKSCGCLRACHHNEYYKH